MSDTIAKLRDLLLNSSKAGRLRGLLDSIYGAASTGAEAYGSASSPMSAEHSGLLGGLLMDMSPLGDAKSAYDGVQSAREGDWVGAGLGGLGALPIVPNITAWHGSKKLFDRFDPTMMGQRDDGWLGRGGYLSTDKKVADWFPVQMQFDADIKNPLNLSMPDWKTDKRRLVREVLGLPREASADDVTKAARAKGYDSVVLDYSPTGYQHKEIAVFDTDTMKRIKD